MKKVSLIFILCFLAVQTFSLLHAIEHDFHASDHDERTCGMYIFVDHTKYTAPADSAIISASHYDSAPVAWQGHIFVASFAYQFPPSRAPPVFS